MFGNHQNSARVVKKADPNINVVGDADTVIDKHSSIETKSEPIPEENPENTITSDVSTESDDVSSEPDDVDSLIDEVKAGLEPTDPIAAENDLATLQGQKEENILDELQAQDSQEEEGLTEDEAKALEEEEEEEHEKAEEAAEAEEQSTEQQSVEEEPSVEESEPAPSQ